MNENTKHIIKELKEKLQNKIDNGPIDMTADQMWKYSGEIEEPTDIFDQENPKHYKHKEIKDVIIYNTFNEKENLIIDYYFRDPNKIITDIAYDIKMSKDFVTKTISKYLNMKKNEKSNNE